MTGLLLALFAAVATGVGARDPALVAGLTERQGARPAVLLVASAVSLATAALAAAAGSSVAALLTPRARVGLAAIALAVSAMEMWLMKPGRKPKEPTNSIGALILVLLAQQLTSAARFLVFAVAVAAAAPIPTGIGGAVGGAAVVTAAWLAPELASSAHVRTLRRVVGALLMVVALVLAFRTLA